MSSSSRDRLDAALRSAMIISSAMLLLLGFAIAALGTLPSPVPSFFVLIGAHAFAAGAAGFFQRFTKGHGPLRGLIRLASGLLSAALIVRIAWLIADGTILGAMTVIAPILIGVPALINLYSAVLGFGRPIPPNSCAQCSYDLNGLDASCCPECGAKIGSVVG